MKKTHNQDMIQQLMDEGDYSPLYPIITQSNLSPIKKLLLTLMFNDIRMNGSITWKQQTYADKLNLSRQSIHKNIKWLIEYGILESSENNKAGGKQNTYTVSFSKLDTCKQEITTCKPEIQVEPVNIEPQPVNIQPQPVNIETSTCKHTTNNVIPSLHIKKDKETNKENNKESLKTEPEITSFDVFMKGADEDRVKTPKEIDMDMFLMNLDI